jgi:ATP adenylyltransferase
MKYLSAPWRWSFISGLKQEKGCFFCRALQGDDEAGLILYRGDDFFIILNKYPYSSGHLMIAPRLHLDSPERLDGAGFREMWDLSRKALAALRSAFQPEGFNIGMNIGQAAGAGVKDHFHLHVVPRWPGDANFMPVVSGTRVASYDLAAVYSRLRVLLQAGSGLESGMSVTNERSMP